MSAESRKSRVEGRECARRVVLSTVVLRPSTAFTLVEMLVVLAIMGIIAAMVVPAIKNFGHADAMTAADQQMVGDVARARQLAMSGRTTVYMVFVPANFWDNFGFNLANLTANERVAATNLCGYQLTGYTFMSYGNVGDQPGQHQWHYLAPWQSLPDGTFIARQKFDLLPSQYFTIPSYNPGVQMHGFNTRAFPFPTEDSPMVQLPYIAFNYMGQLTTNGTDMASSPEYIALAKGAVLPAINPDTKVYEITNAPNLPQIIETPAGNSTNAYNLLYIDQLTGRATLETPKVK